MPVPFLNETWFSSRTDNRSGIRSNPGPLEFWAVCLFVCSECLWPWCNAARAHWEILFQGCTWRAKRGGIRNKGRRRTAAPLNGLEDRKIKREQWARTGGRGFVSPKLYKPEVPSRRLQSSGFLVPSSAEFCCSACLSSYSYGNNFQTLSESGTLLKRDYWLWLADTLGFNCLSFESS